MIIRARTVVPIASEPIENGAVVIAGNKIIEVGRFDDLKTSHDGDLVDLGEHILLPGLINAHCHLDYTMLRGRISRQRTFTDWIRAINALKATLTDQDYLSGIVQGFAEARSFGTTTLVNLEAFPGLLPRLQTPQLRTWWCAEMIDVRESVSLDEICDKLRFAMRGPTLGGIGLAPHALYTASQKLFSDSADLARSRDLLLTTHLAESQEEMEMFCDTSGPLFEFLRSIGRPMDDCGSATPIATLLRRQKIDQHWIIAHLNEITESDFELLDQSPRFQIAHCPSSHSFFGHSPFALQRLQKLGFNICLGTDSLASNSSLSLFSEMRSLLREAPSVSARQALEMATINGARAIGQGGSLGSIGAGLLADLIAIPAESERSVYDTIIAFEGKVPWMMVNGQVLPNE